MFLVDDIDKLGKFEFYIYEYVVVEFGVVFEECVVIEDLINGIEVVVWFGVYIIVYCGG